MKTADSKENLCDTCGACFADCDATEVLFGDGVGDDNVVECDAYVEK